MSETSSTPNGQTNGPANGKPEFDHKRLEQYLDIVANEATSRSMLMRRMTTTLDPRRSIDDECGYPPTSNVGAKDYQELYDRDSIANRVVEVLAKESWKVSPLVYESEDADEVTLFEERWDTVGKRLRGSSLFRDELGGPIYDYLQRLDIQSGIGHFGIMLIGIDDGKALSEPAEFINQPDPKDGTWKPNDEAEVNLNFLRVFPESLVQITRYETEVTSPRNGQPLMYSVTFNDPSEQHGGVGLTTATAEVHWTRVQHVPSGDLGSSEVFGPPRLRSVLNHVLNLRKLYGAASEGYWRSCFTGLSFETNPALGGNVPIDVPGLRDQFERYINGLDRGIVTRGMVVKTLAPSVVDPKSQIDAQLQAICIKIPVPMRVFMGSERGELASSQDASQWDDTIRARQLGVVTPRILVPFIDRLIALGVLPVPVDGYSVDWPSLSEQSATEKATIAGLIMTALSSYVAGNVQALIAPVDALTKILGWDEEEVLQMLENAAKEAEVAMEAEIVQQEDLIERGLAPDPLAPPEIDEFVENWDVAWEGVDNQFCPTGDGGGSDHTCKPKTADVTDNDQSGWEEMSVVEDDDAHLPPDHDSKQQIFAANIEALRAENNLTDEEVEALRESYQAE